LYDLTDVTLHAGPKEILRDLTWQVGPGDRIAVVGANGAGKTTLLRLLAGRLAPESGTMVTGSTVRTAFLSQELVELPGELRVLEAVEEVARRVVLGGREMSAAQLAEVFGFGDQARGSAEGGKGSLWTPVSDLSGGERRRLQMLRLLAGEPNVLLLDEPTNDLDTDTLASLEDLLDSWPGTIVVASHDRYLVERVTDDVYGMFGDGRLVHLPGGIDEYLARVGEPDKPTMSVPAAKPRDDRDGGGLSAAEVRVARKELARLERQVGKLEKQEDALHDELAAHATDYAKVADLDARLKAVSAERARTEEEWLALAEQVDSGLDGGLDGR
jgi:ABC transport system ATP-binding/permease protein